MELKLITPVENFTLGIDFNRTRLELKLITPVENFTLGIDFNRTRLELKLVYDDVDSRYLVTSTVPDWN